MLTIIPLLSFLIFAVTYPLCFWLNYREPLKNNFHHFHIGHANIIGGLAVAGMFLIECPEFIRTMGIIWLIEYFFVTFIFWKKESVNPLAATLISITGLILYGFTHVALIGFDIPALIVSVLAGLIVSAAFYAMNLGHWYLNVHGLSLVYLKRASLALVFLLAARLVWDTVMLFTSRVMFKGDLVPIWVFMTRMDGFLLLIAFFFGTLFPLISMYFVWGTLKVKSTQSATGILYVLLSAVLIGDLTYKYYLLNFHLAF